MHIGVELLLVDGRLARLERQYQPEHRAYAAWIFTGQIAAVCPRVAACDSQPESGAPGIVCPTMIKSYEAFENPLSLGRRHPRPGVPDFGNRELILLAYHDMHISLRA